MVISAILARFENPWVAVGAILFLISDSLLAVNKFKTPVPYRDFLVWSTYYAGQYGIAVGFLATNSFLQFRQRYRERLNTGSNSVRTPRARCDKRVSTDPQWGQALQSTYSRPSCFRRLGSKPCRVANPQISSYGIGIESSLAPTQ